MRTSAAHSNELDIRTISLCAGGAGLDIGLELAIPGARAVVYLEREAFGVARLVEAMQAGFLADAPVWSDVSTFRSRPWRGLVDGVIGGIPCQPHSMAGKRKGADDERDLWPDTRRIIAGARPWFVLIENVAGMLVGPEGQIAGAARVRRDLAGMSFRTEVVLVRASEVGASHERARTFILALADARFGGQRGEGDDGYAPGRLPDAGSGELGDSECARRAQARRRHSLDAGPQPEPGSRPLANPIGRRHGRDAGAPRRGSCERTAAEGAGAGSRELDDASGRRCNARGGHEAQGCGQPEQPIDDTVSDMAHADVAELCGQSPARQLAQSQRDDALSLFPPGPGDRSAWERIARERPDLLPATAQPRLRGMADGMAARVDQLRMLGNGVVPLQAAYAIRLLVDAHARFGASTLAKYLHRSMNQ